VFKKIRKRVFQIDLIQRKPFNSKQDFIKKGDYDYLVEKLTYELLVPRKELRLESLLEVLKKNKIVYEIEKEGEIRNVIVRLGDLTKDEDFAVYGAHYDIVDGSFGINDNTCAVAMLIAFIINRKDYKERMDVVFFDKEEDGLKGSKLYVKKYKDKIKYALILDIIGVGDTIVYNSNLAFDKLEMNLPFKKIINRLKSDNITFIKNDLPVVLISALYKKELIFIEGNKNKIEGKMLNNESYHGGNDDNRIEIINFYLINELSGILLNISNKHYSKIKFEK